MDIKTVLRYAYMYRQLNVAANEYKRLLEGGDCMGIFREEFLGKNVRVTMVNDDGRECVIEGKVTGVGPSYIHMEGGGYMMVYMREMVNIEVI